MTTELRPCAALALSPARSGQVGKKELDDHSGPTPMRWGPRSGKTANDNFSTFGNHEISVSRKAGSGQPGTKSEMPTKRQNDS